MYICKYFDIRELVSKQVYEKYGDQCWQFFDDRILKFIDWLRDRLNAKITINDWLWGGVYDERGLRANLDSIVKENTHNNKIYCSQHCFGRALDFDIENMTAQRARRWFEENKDLLPFPIWCEAGVSWIHCDVRQSEEKLHFF
jgi:hypothetical protein